MSNCPACIQLANGTHQRDCPLMLRTTPAPKYLIESDVHGAIESALEITGSGDGQDERQILNYEILTAALNDLVEQNTQPELLENAKNVLNFSDIQRKCPDKAGAVMLIIALENLRKAIRNVERIK